MKQTTFARWLLAITCTHLMFALVIFHAEFMAMLNAGWWGQVGPDNLKGAVAFWFMLFTWPLMMTVINMWSNPNRVSRALLMLGFIGSIVAGTANPLSGFWTITLLCFVALLMSRANVES